MLVPLSHVIVTVQFRKPRNGRDDPQVDPWNWPQCEAAVVIVVAYVHCDDTPLRSAI